MDFRYALTLSVSAVLERRNLFFQEVFVELSSYRTWLLRLSIQDATCLSAQRAS